MINLTGVCYDSVGILHTFGNFDTVSLGIVRELLDSTCAVPHDIATPTTRDQRPNITITATHLFAFLTIRRFDHINNNVMQRNSSNPFIMSPSSLQTS